MPAGVRLYHAGMSSTIGERIRIAREAKGWSQLKLGEAVGVSRAAVSQWESGESKGLKPENLVAAARELGVDIEWLVTGTPDMREDRSRYRSDDGVSGTGVPLLDWQSFITQGGTRPFPAPQIEEWLTPPVGCSADSFALRVHAPGMAPRFRDGELIFVDPQRDARHGDFVVVRLADGEVLLRELLIEAGMRMLRATHPDWPAPLRALGTDDTLLGVVIARLERF